MCVEQLAAACSGDVLNRWHQSGHSGQDAPHGFHLLFGSEIRVWLGFDQLRGGIRVQPLGIFGRTREGEDLRIFRQQLRAGPSIAPLCLDVVPEPHQQQSRAAFDRAGSGCTSSCGKFD
jgi:hypothetical protein